jgi:hypothetical protein
MMKRHQLGHADFSFLYWFAAAIGALLTGGGGAILWWAVRGLMR